MVDFGEAQRKARVNMSRKTCAAWRKFNANKISYDEAQVIIKAAEDECNEIVEAAYVASDTRGTNTSAATTSNIAAGESEVVTVSP